MSHTKRIALLKPLKGLALLFTVSSHKKCVSFYMLVKEPGSSTALTWDFGDGKIIREKGLNLTTATNLPNIMDSYNARGILFGSDHLASSVFSAGSIIAFGA